MSACKKFKLCCVDSDFVKTAGKKSSKFPQV